MRIGPSQTVFISSDLYLCYEKVSDDHFHWNLQMCLPSLTLGTFSKFGEKSIKKVRKEKSQSKLRSLNIWSGIV